MKSRCYRPSHPAWKYYGAKGVKVCERWKNSFKAFLADMGEAPDGYWIDRIDNTKDYEPGNCRWVTPKQSAQNRKPRGKMPGSLKDKARNAGLPYHVVYYRVMRYFWPEDVALSTPVMAPGQKLPR